MKLYIDENGRRLYLRHKVRTRKELRDILGSDEFKANGKVYRVSKVKAEIDQDTRAIAAGVGLLVGALGGVPGAFVGGLIGGAVGSAQLDKERKIVESFNAS